MLTCASVNPTTNYHQVQLDKEKVQQEEEEEERGFPAAAAQL